MNPDINSQLLEALQTGSAIADNPMIQTLLAQDAAQYVSVLPSAGEILAQLESVNPTAGLIARYFLARQESERDSSLEEEAEAEGPQAAEEQQLIVEQSERLAQMIERLEEMKAIRREIEQLRQSNHALAAALGACHRCWGREIDCPVCHGHGHPGSAMPDKRLFIQWVLPTLQYLETRKEVRGIVPIISNGTDQVINLQTQKGEKNE